MSSQGKIVAIRQLYQFAECIVEGKPVSKNVLELILALTGFEPGAVFLGDTENRFKLKLRLGSFKDIKAVRILCNRFLDIRPSEILTYAYIPLLDENTLTGILCLDSTVNVQPSIDAIAKDK